MASPLIPIGIVTSAHGVRGQVKLRSFTTPAEAIFSYASFTDPSGQRSFSLTRMGGGEPAFIASIAGIADRNAAEALKGVELCVPASTLPEKEDNDWYYAELIGLQARLQNGSPYGTIVNLHNFGAGDILDIERIDGSSEMLPFTEAFVGRVAPEQGFIEIFPPDYITEKME